MGKWTLDQQFELDLRCDFLVVNNESRMALLAMARIRHANFSRSSLPLAARTGHSDAVDRHSGLAEPSTCSRRATDVRSFWLPVRTGLLCRHRLSGGDPLLQRVRLLWCWAVSRAV
jgi:hypothetical protein